MASQPHFRTEQVQGVTVVSFKRPAKFIEEAMLPEIGAELMAAIDVKPPLVVLNLDGVEFFSSSFIEILFRAWNRLKARSGKFAICSLHPYCRQVLEITNLHRVWPLRKTQEEAIEALLSEDSNDSDVGHQPQ